jgi:hypothetical protein
MYAPLGWNQNRDARTGDRVKVEGGPYDGRTGRVEQVKGPDDVLFERGSRPLVGLLNEDMALVTFEHDKGDGSGQVGVPVRRLRII